MVGSLVLSVKGSVATGPLMASKKVFLASLQPPTVPHDRVCRVVHPMRTPYSPNQDHPLRLHVVPGLEAVEEDVGGEVGSVELYSVFQNQADSRWRLGRIDGQNFPGYQTTRYKPEKSTILRIISEVAE